jgi:hypothetical protein
MATAQLYRNPASPVDIVYSIIKSRSGKVRAKDLDRLIGNKQEVRFAITRLTIQGKIKRIRGFGKAGIEYFYRDTASEQVKQTSEENSQIF